MPYPKEEDNRMIALLHLLVHRRVITKQEATDLFQNGKRPISEKMKKQHSTFGINFYCYLLYCNDVYLSLVEYLHYQ